MCEIRNVILRYEIDVLAVTETKLNSTAENFKVNIKGFRLFRTDRKSNGGGVAVYVKNHIAADLKRNLMMTEIEIIWVEIKQPDGETVLVGCCYRPPRSEEKYLRHICENIKKVSNEGKPILLMGDFNIYWFENSPQKRKISSVMDECKLMQIVNDKTRDCPINRTSKCIDHIYTDLQWSNLQCGYELPSDHKLIMVNVSVNQTICNKMDKIFNAEQFVSDIKKVQWTEVIKEFIPKNALSKFKEIFLQIADNHNPWKIIKLEEVKKPDQDLEHSRKKQKTFSSQDLTAAENDPQKLLKILREILGESLPPHLNHFNQNRFKSQSIDSVFKGQEAQIINKVGTSFRFLIVGPETVERLLHSLNLPVVNEKDEMTQEMLRLAAKQISGPMCYILNRCINNEECEKGPTSEVEKVIPFSQNMHPDMVDFAFSFIFDLVLFEQTKQHFTGSTENTLQTTLQKIHTEWLSNGLDKENIQTLFVKCSFSYDVLINKLKSHGFSDQALSFIKCFFFSPFSSNRPSQRSFLIRFLFTIFSNEFTSVFRTSSVYVCENHMLIFNAHQNSQTLLKREMASLHNKAYESQVTLDKTGPCAIRCFTEILNIFEIHHFFFLCHRYRLNWIAVFKTIIQKQKGFKNDCKDIFQKLETYFGNGSSKVTEKIKQSVMNLLVLSRLEY